MTTTTTWQGGGVIPYTKFSALNPRISGANSDVELMRFTQSNTGTMFYPTIGIHNTAPTNTLDIVNANIGVNILNGRNASGALLLHSVQI